MADPSGEVVASATWLPESHHETQAVAARASQLVEATKHANPTMRTPEIPVTVQELEVASAVMDEKWDMVSRA